MLKSIMIHLFIFSFDRHIEMIVHNLTAFGQRQNAPHKHCFTDDIVRWKRKLTIHSEDNRKSHSVNLKKGQMVEHEPIRSTPSLLIWMLSISFHKFYCPLVFFLNFLMYFLAVKVERKIDKTVNQNDRHLIGHFKCNRKLVSDNWNHNAYRTVCSDATISHL